MTERESQVLCKNPIDSCRICGTINVSSTYSRGPTKVSAAEPQSAAVSSVPLPPRVRSHFAQCASAIHQIGCDKARPQRVAGVNLYDDRIGHTGFKRNSADFGIGHDSPVKLKGRILERSPDPVHPLRPVLPPVPLVPAADNGTGVQEMGRFAMGRVLEIGGVSGGYKTIGLLIGTSQNPESLLIQLTVVWSAQDGTESIEADFLRP